MSLNTKKRYTEPVLDAGPCLHHNHSTAALLRLWIRKQPEHELRHILAEAWRSTQPSACSACL
jgi:hypothetical protein